MCLPARLPARRPLQVSAKPKNAALPVPSWTEVDDSSYTGLPIYLPAGGIGNLT